MISIWVGEWGIIKGSSVFGTSVQLSIRSWLRDIAKALFSFFGVVGLSETMCISLDVHISVFWTNRSVFIGDVKSLIVLWENGRRAVDGVAGSI